MKERSRLTTRGNAWTAGICKIPYRGRGPTRIFSQRHGGVRVRCLPFLAQCPSMKQTPLRDVPPLLALKMAGAARVTIQGQRGRMGLGVFKALGPAYAIRAWKGCCPAGGALPQP